MSDRIVITRKRPGPNDSSVREVLDNYGLRKMYNFGTRNFECLFIPPVNRNGVSPRLRQFFLNPYLHFHRLPEIYAALNPVGYNPDFILVNTPRVDIHFIANMTALETLLAGLNPEYNFDPILLNTVPRSLDFRFNGTEGFLALNRLYIHKQRLYESLSTSYDILSSLNGLFYFNEYTMRVRIIQLDMIDDMQRLVIKNNFARDHDIISISTTFFVVYTNERPSLTYVVPVHRGNGDNPMDLNYLIVFNDASLFMHGWMPDNSFVELFDNRRFSDYVALAIANNINTMPTSEMILLNRNNMPQLRLR